MSIKETSTDNIFEMIEENSEKFIDSIDSEKFTDYKSMFTKYLYDLLKNKKMTISNLVYKTTLSQSYLYQIASGTRHLGRDTPIILAFAIGLDLDQTQRLLKYSNNAVLYPKVKRDAIIICCIDCKMTYEQANEILLSKSEKGLV